MGTGGVYSLTCPDRREEDLVAVPCGWEQLREYNAPSFREGRPSPMHHNLGERSLPGFPWRCGVQGVGAKRGWQHKGAGEPEQ